MLSFFPELGFLPFVFACLITVIAGFVKGATGFAMPMIMISGLASILSAEAALAALILPTVVTNAAQALRQGFGSALESAKKYRLYLGLVLVFILGSAQLVSILPQKLLFILIGAPITLFSVTQIMGWTLQIRPEHKRRAEIIIGSFAGFVGGLSGVWGPPTVAYLTALNTEKREQIRIQGVIYGLGAVALLLAHIKSGVFNADSAPFSALMLVPAMIGMWVGVKVQDRLDQAKFKKVTLFVLMIAGLNLVRRGLIG
ncbi:MULTISPECIES: sulfite exporter TauE/SafE family protein [Halocynthiibacter]|uniref:Probable membrane transporter protein n=1 Tax=Halocynthiibacter halioticoli TaxID=2986804 RepID=A0AAE3LUU6_9RHOB|nr:MULTISPECIES: sulfite exporter TauE/SafE family protein [Halocynthiibacter]MCV6825900.1 sulfite exporter TauE/SafE family protein [Halocynthiibacter halioticoli]MCW4058901.1 sulfite exporter TauE/SafE family protein [Halocynthiibacter sp. SDUM655004]